MTSRYFANSFRRSGKPEINEKFYKKRILECVEKIIRNLEPSRRSGEKGLYTGCAGVSYALYYLKEANLFPDRNDEFARKAQTYLEPALNKDSMRRRNSIGLMSGNSGIYLLAALLYSQNGDERTSKFYLKKYGKLADECKVIEFLENGCDEMFVGRSGYLFGLLLLERNLEVEVLSKRDLHGICNAIIESGLKLRRKVDVPEQLPLYYEYHSKPYLGAGHGFSAILQVLLSVPTYLNHRSEVLKLVKQAVDFLMDLCSDENNIATNLKSALSGDGKMLVHWCHGAAGIIYLFARAYLVYDRNEKYLEACRRLAETIWEKGLLKKGPGICHGVSSSGYAFLLMYRLTGEENYLYRAERFASFMFTEDFSEARTPDRPYSLFEGWAGTVCFLTDLLRPDEAEFPFMNVFVE